jgi:hypothetical protein
MDGFISKPGLQRVDMPAKAQIHLFYGVQKTQRLPN